MAQRRSSRKTERSQRQEQNELATSACLNRIDPPGFDVKYINSFIGSGVFVNENFKKGTFLLEYPGELLTWKEGQRREEKYVKDGKGLFLYFFKCKEKFYCVDATFLDGTLHKGRMINDAVRKDDECNAEMRIIGVEGRPHLCIFALKDIKKGTEVRYDYGVESLPWRNQRTAASLKRRVIKGNDNENHSKQKKMASDKCEPSQGQMRCLDKDDTERATDEDPAPCQSTKAKNTEALDMIDKDDDTLNTTDKGQNPFQGTKANNTEALNMICEEHMADDTESATDEGPVLCQDTKADSTTVSTVIYTRVPDMIGIKPQ